MSLGELLKADVTVAALAYLVAFAVTGAAIGNTIRGWRSSDGHSGLPGHAWQGLLFAAVLDGLILAGFGVARWFDLFVQGWGSIVGIVTALFGGWLAYKGVKEAKSSTWGGE